MPDDVEMPAPTRITARLLLATARVILERCFSEEGEERETDTIAAGEKEVGGRGRATKSKVLGRFLASPAAAYHVPITSRRVAACCSQQGELKILRNHHEVNALWDSVSTAHLIPFAAMARERTLSSQPTPITSVGVLKAAINLGHTYQLKDITVFIRARVLSPTPGTAKTPNPRRPSSTGPSSCTLPSQRPRSQNPGPAQ